MSESNSTVAAGSSRRTPEQKRKAADYAKKWRRANPEKSKAAWRRWFVRHRKHRQDYCREYRKLHPDRVRETQRKHNKKHKLKRNAYSRRWCQLHKTARREYMLAYCKRNREHRRKIYREWVARNPAKVQARHQRWRDRNRVKIAATNAARKAFRRGGGTGDKAVSALIRQWKSKPHFTCYWCGALFPRKRLHIDHIVPVKKGGKHTCDNICRSCPTCNVRKKHYLVSDPDFIGQRQLML
jgi:hypothetical protein